MEEKQLDAVTRRLEHLERQVRRWKTFGIGIVATLGIAALLAAPGGRDAKAQETSKDYHINVPKEFLQGYAPTSTEEIRAKRVVLVDPRGKIRGRLQVSSGGTPSIELYGPSGKTHASMAVKGSGQPHIALYDRLGRVLWRKP